jgi:hypothetical protein
VLIAAGAVTWLVEAAQAQSAHPCAGAAQEQARRLLAFHVGSGDHIDIDPSVKRLNSIRNPADSTQRFDVLEVWAYVYKGQYRMRFIYAQLPGECLLMGQEILEYAPL